MSNWLKHTCACVIGAQLKMTRSDSSKMDLPSKSLLLIIVALYKISTGSTKKKNYHFVYNERMNRWIFRFYFGKLDTWMNVCWNPRIILFVIYVAYVLGKLYIFLIFFSLLVTSLNILYGSNYSVLGARTPVFVCLFLWSWIETYISSFIYRSLFKFIDSAK